MISLFAKLFVQKDCKFNERVHLAVQEIELKIKNDAADILITKFTAENERVQLSNIQSKPS